jgi:hypothetical protein
MRTNLRPLDLTRLNHGFQPNPLSYWKHASRFVRVTANLLSRTVIPEDVMLRH